MRYRLALVGWENLWGFELQGVVPDIVTLGKPIGNGHPLAAVITTAEIAEAFANGMEYFNTFGGNPVSAAVGNAVLDVIEEEDLQKHALTLGNDLLERWKGMSKWCPALGQVRGEVSFLVWRFVADPVQRAPYSPSNLCCGADESPGFLLSTDGPDHNVIKFKPPLVFQKSEAERLCHNLEQILPGSSSAANLKGSTNTHVDFNLGYLSSINCQRLEPANEPVLPTHPSHNFAALGRTALLETSANILSLQDVHCLRESPENLRQTLTGRYRCLQQQLCSLPAISVIPIGSAVLSPC